MRKSSVIAITRGNEVLMGQRRADLAFLGGFHAFVGGNVEEIDLGDEPEVTFGPEVGGIPTMIDNGEDSDGGDESSEDDDDEEDDEKPKKESYKAKKTKKILKESTLVANFYGFV